jgi:hypothetical protein
MKAVRLNIAFNISKCTGLFGTRYENAGALQAQREGEKV